MVVHGIVAPALHALIEWLTARIVAMRFRDAAAGRPLGKAT